MKSIVCSNYISINQERLLRYGFNNNIDEKFASKDDRKKFKEFNVFASSRQYL